MFDKKKSELLAKKIRIHALQMTQLGKSSHIGSNLSIADILAVLYSSILHYNSNNPNLKSRDRFILSKGHAGAVLYATLAECGFMPLEKLRTHCQNGSDLSGHISHKEIPGVELSTGSLGHGLPVACGMALAAKINKKKHRIFALLSDGECDEGSNWEAVLCAAHHKLDNLTVIIDRNRLQSIYSTEDTLALEPLGDKWKSFGWDVVQINGHNHNELFQSCSNDNNLTTKPLCVIANTIKGKGVSFMENNTLWHYRSPQDEEYRLAMEELEKKDA